MTRLFFTLSFIAISFLGFSQLHTLPFAEDFATMQLPNGWSQSGTWNYDTGNETFPTASNGYIYSEINWGFTSETKELLTPFIDVSAVTNPLNMRVSLTSRQDFESFCNILLTKDAGLTWDTIQKVVPVDGFDLSKDLTPYISGVDSIQIRFSYGFTGMPAGSSSSILRFAFDDFLIAETFDQDLGILSINTPNSGCEYTDTVNISVFNYGTSTFSENITLSYSTDNGANWIDEQYNATITTNHSFDFTFSTTANLTQGVSNIIVKLTSVNDQNSANDEKTKLLSISPSVQAFPYTADFENNDASWFADNSNSGSWEWGAPNANTINTGANGSANAWVTNLTGNYNNYEVSYLYSPCFDLSSLNAPVFEADIFYQLTGTISGMYSGAILEYSTDNGNNWTSLGTNYSGGDNWYDYQQGWYGINNEWKHAMHDMSALANEPKVNFRISFKGFNQPAEEGFAIDNIFIHEAFANDLKMMSINSPESNCGLSSETINITVANIGTNDVSSFDIEYTIDGTNWVTESISQTITAGNDVDIDLSQTIDLSTNNVYTLQVKAVLTGDENTSNNEKSITVVNQPLLSGTEIFEDFETVSTSQFWIKDQAWNSSTNDWELASPANSGTNAWLTNATGNYALNQTAYVVSPCMDISGITNPAIEFYLNNHVGAQANFNVEYSADNGLTWNALGATPASNPHWYNSPYSSFTFTTQGYVAKRRTITDINAIMTNSENIKFRFVFTSGTGTPDLGSAFDDFKIYQDDTLALTSSVNPIISENNNFEIYPNPAQNHITIKNISSDVNYIQILDLTGKTVKIVSNFEQNTESVKLNISTLQNGVYFIKVGTEVQKFIKE